MSGGGGGGGGLDLERRLADGEAAIMLAVIRWVHACADVTVERHSWVRMRDRAMSSADGRFYTAVEAEYAEDWRRAAVACAHEAHTLERLLDARDRQRAQGEI